MIKITLDDVSRYADEALEEKGKGYVYDQPLCKYVIEMIEGLKAPGCLVGNILHRAGVSLETLGDNEVGVNGLITELEDSGIIKISPQAKMFLTVVQRAQDLKVPWGVATAIGDAASYGMIPLSE